MLRIHSVLMVSVFISSFSCPSLHAQSIPPEEAPVLGENWSLSWISDGTQGPASTFGYAYIYDVAVSDDMSEVYILDGMANTIWRLNPTTGEVLRSFGREGSGPGEFQSAYQITWASGGLWLADTGLNRLTRYSSSGDYEYSVNIQNFAVQPIHKLIPYSDSQLLIHTQVVRRSASSYSVFVEITQGSGAVVPLVSLDQVFRTAPEKAVLNEESIVTRVIPLDSDRWILGFHSPPVLFTFTRNGTTEFTQLVDLSEIIDPCPDFQETRKAGMSACGISMMEVEAGSNRLHVLVTRQDVSRTPDDYLHADTRAKEDYIFIVDSTSGEVLEQRTVEFDEWSPRYWQPDRMLLLTGTIDDVPVLVRYDYRDVLRE
ncbi:hypothetical protein ACFL41_00645 [Gemmatimonadota bacterium]